MSARSLLTLVFTDVEGSTALRSRVGDADATALLLDAEHRARAIVAAHNGRVVKSLGDGLMLAFVSPGDAIACAVDIQDGERDQQLAFRMGITTGEVDDEGSDLHGQAVHAAARIMSKAKGGEILVAEVTTQLAGPLSGVGYVDRGRSVLRGLPGRWHLFGLEWTPSPPSPRKTVTPKAPVRRGRPAVELFGRQPERELIATAAKRSAAGEFRCVFVVGDAGVGKSSLAAAVLHDAACVGLTARGYPLGATDSFGVWLEACETHLRGLPPGEVRRYCGAHIDELAGVLPSVRAAGVAPPLTEPPRSHVLHALAAVLTALAQDEAVVVVLDDIHLADATSWEALGWFARNLADSPILVVATARPAELRQHTAAGPVLHSLEQDGCSQTLSLEPLDAADVARLAERVIGHDPPAALVTWLNERSRGNPLFALGLVRALVEEGADLHAPRLDRLPEALADRVATRIAGLDEPIRATLETLSVLGSRVEIQDLVALAGRPLDRLAPILDELVELRLATADERGRQLIYETSHPLVQEAIYEQLGPARRRALHRRIARELVERGRLAMAAPHFARSADSDDDEAIKALGDAVRQAEDRELYREALAMLGVLKDILPAGDDRWMDIIDSMSWNADWVVDHRADMDALHGVAALQEIARLLHGTHDKVRLASVQLRLASFLAWGAGEIEPARILVADAVQAFEAAGRTSQALVGRNEAAWLAGMHGDAKALIAAGRDVLRRAESAGDRFVIMQSTGMLGACLAIAGAFDEAEVLLRRSAAIAGEDGKRYRRNWNQGILAMALGCQGRIAESRSIMAEVRADPQHVETIAVEEYTFVQLLAGDYAAVLQVADELVARYPDGLSRRRAWALAVAATCAAEMGRLTEARRLLGIAARAYEGRRWICETDQCDWSAAVLDWIGGRPEDAVRQLQSLARTSAESSFGMQGLPMLVDLAELGGARREDLDAAASQCDGPLYAALAQLGRASIALCEGRASAEGAAQIAEEAAASFGELGSAVYEGRALVVAGTARAIADRESAASLFVRAAAAFEACGAAWRRDRVLALLGGLGGAGRRRAAAARGPASLTDREREVVRLTMEGRTAKETAASLFIGERTVETHLANAYAKLGVQSKRELQRRAADLDL